jgi:cytochrome c biogenesis protein CcdA/YHS domain-containing protein
MNGLVYSASLTAAFLGGVLALFAPCCVVTLLPNFVGASLRRGLRGLPGTTLLFSAGLSVVLLPIVLGTGAIGHVIGRYHALVFMTLGVFLISLGAYVLTGRRWTLPIPTPRWTARSKNGEASTFFLGVGSGIASSCCAPVVAGVVAMSTLSGSWIGGLGLGLSYVFGMVFPLMLFAIAAARRGERRQTAPRHVTIFGRDLVWTDAVSGLMFVVFGGVTFLLGVSGQESVTPGPLAAWDRWMTARFADLAMWLGKMPLALQAALLIGLALSVALPLRRVMHASKGKVRRPPRPRIERRRDPVCGMAVTVGDGTPSADWRGSIYHFCASTCRDEFVDDPGRFVGSSQPV